METGKALGMNCRNLVEQTVLLLAGLHKLIRKTVAAGNPERSAVVGTSPMLSKGIRIQSCITLWVYVFVMFSINVCMCVYLST